MPAIHGAEVRGVDVDPETRCAHYASERDVVAIKFACCGTYYPCYRCHEATSDHPAEVWSPNEFDEPAILCGVCGAEQTVSAYLSADDSACPDCRAPFNPGCRNHRHRYFAVAADPSDGKPRRD